MELFKKNAKAPVELKPLGIYVHVPFCRSKCEYCDFYSLGGGLNQESMDLYLQAILTHIKEAAQRAVGYSVDSIYFGGGTPSFFGEQGLIRILSEIDRRFLVEKDAEITLEANPDSVTAQSLAKLRRAGFNRISIGVQCDDDAQLKSLGRPHTYKQAQMAVSQARRVGFANISVDLMFGLPSQSREQWMSTLRNVMDLKVDHISCYGLKVEPNTRLYEYRDCANLPDDDAQADMYFYAVETLESFGYVQYEISNFSLPGMECRHNMKYWTGQPYMGFGPAASSDFGGKRYTAAADLDRYITGVMEQGIILSECESIPLRERAGEYLMLRLRTAHGIEENEYMQTYLLPFEPLEKLLCMYETRGLAMKEESGRWRLTPKGFMVSNSILVQLLEAQQQSKPLAKVRK
ncbi:MAG: radical SAM family heme chaperone HemW [Oscillospiraceae bacterium]|nr:radical SAM family heme chaperone HemW [Oscillospiraceae bacterium]